MRKLFCLINAAFLTITLSIDAYSQINDWLDYSLDCYDCSITDTTYRESIYDSRNGYELSPHGEIRFLAVFVELEYDNPNDDPYLNGTDYWGVGALPRWADSLFAAYNTSNYNSKLVTKYYRYASSNNHIVLGDFLMAPDNNGVFKIHTTNGDLIANSGVIIDTINQKLGNNIVTASGTLSSINNFDKWTPTQKGVLKENVRNGKWDYVVYIVRNAKKPSNPNGYTSSGNNKWLLGYKVDYYSLVCVGDKYDPAHVIRHEYAHTLLGGNNFHTCGGGWADSHNYWIPQTGGWAMLGLYGSSLMCWNAWDRYRLGWKAPNNVYDISARAADGTTEVNGDIDCDSGNDIYVLRDFVTTGDALRIKLPFIDTINEYQEWIWIENHQGVANNDFEFDKWQYQRFSCVENYQSGLMAYIQINSNDRVSHYQNIIYNQYADYLNPLTANGFWDRWFFVDSINNGCVNNNSLRPFARLGENPLTGCGDQSFYAVDLDDNDSIYSDPSHKKYDQLNNWTEKTCNDTLRHLYQLGHGDHSFTISGNKKIGIGTNPSSASLINMVGQDKPVINAKNLRTTYLNGISIEILEQNANGNIKVRVRFDDVDIDNDVRWCSDSIVLNEIATQSGYSLNVKKGKSITLDQGLTATRMTNPITFNNQKIFASPTTFTIQPDVRIHIDTTASIVLENSSKLHMREGSFCRIEDEGFIEVKSGTVFQMDDCSLLDIGGNGMLIVRDGAELRISNHAYINANGTQNIIMGNNVIIPEGYANPLALIEPAIDDIQINTLTVWNGYNRTVRGIIKVNTGATLRIESSFLRFKGEDCGIVVDRGGKLIVDGSTLTTSCHNTDYMWKGIEVWGNRNEHQFPVNGTYLQGVLILRNGAIIENALCAVELNNPQGRSHTGGIVSATDAVFRNNATSVHTLSYTNHDPVSGLEADYNGLFKNCTFTIDDDYPGVETFTHHVDIVGINGIRFTGCDFNVKLNVPGVSSGCMGICANDAGFKVLAYCEDGIMLPCPDSGLKRCTFTNFNNGIYTASNGFNARTFDVENAVFINNIIGIYADNTGFATILNSDFDISTRASCNYGVYANNITDFCIEENNFDSYTDSGDVDLYGIGVYDSESINDIYLNTFNNLSCGNLAYGKNFYIPEPHTYLGLTYSCNQNYSNEIDFCALKSGYIGGIQKEQGSLQLPAGNTFRGTTYHFYNAADYTVEYYYNSNNTFEIPEGNKLINVNRNPITISNSCETHYGQGGIAKSPEELADLASVFASTEDAHEKNLAAGDIVRSYLNDSVVNYTELRSWLGNMQKIDADRMIVGSYVQEGDFTNAIALANALPTVYELTGDDLYDHKDYMSLLKLYHDLYISNRTVFELTDNELNMVKNIAENGFGTSKSLATTLLREISGQYGNNCTCPTLPEPIIRKTISSNNNAVKDDVYSVNIIPNPATTQTTLEYQLPEKAALSTLRIMNSLGIIVLEISIYDDKGTRTLDLGKLPAGVYTYIFKSGNYLKTDKLIITR